MGIYALRMAHHTKFEQVTLACGLFFCYAYRAALGSVVLPLPLSNMYVGAV